MEEEDKKDLLEATYVPDGKHEVQRYLDSLPADLSGELAEFETAKGDEIFTTYPEITAQPEELAETDEPELKKLPTVDGRVIFVPEPEEVVDTKRRPVVVTGWGMAKQKVAGLKIK